MLSPIKYPGGKSRMADKIIELFPANYEELHYIEVFGGSAAVLLNKKPSVLEIYNDLNDLLYNLFKVIRDKPEKLFELYFLTLHSRTALKEAKRNLDKGTVKSDVYKALYMLIRSNMSFSGYGTGFNLATKKPVIPTSVPMKVHFFEIADRLKNVYIENCDFREIIEKTDTKESLYYIDPPYIVGHKYDKMMPGIESSFTIHDHKELAFMLGHIKGKFVLSIDVHPDVVKLYDKPRYKFHYYESYTGGKYIARNGDKRQKSTEILITNY